MKKDIISEMIYGIGAIKTVGRIVVIKQHSYEGLPRTLIGGIVIEHLNEDITKKSSTKILADSLEYELWEGEILFIPKRKYRGRHPEHEGFSGLRIDQVLCSNWGSPEAWLEKIFDKDKSND